MRSLRAIKRGACLMGMLAAAAAAVAATITFDDYPGGTVITDQYIDLGVQFSGAPMEDSPVIYDYGGELGRILRSHDWYSAMVIRFVVPGVPGTVQPVGYIAFENPASGPDYIVINVYNDADEPIYSAISTSPDYVVMDFEGNVAAYMVLDDDQGTAYVIDDLTVERDPTPVDEGSWSRIKRLY